MKKFLLGLVLLGLLLGGASCKKETETKTKVPAKEVTVEKKATLVAEEAVESEVYLEGEAGTSTNEEPTPTEKQEEEQEGGDKDEEDEEGEGGEEGEKGEEGEEGEYYLPEEE